MEEKEPPGRTNCEKIIPRAIEMRKKESSWAALSLVEPPGRTNSEKIIPRASEMRKRNQERKRARGPLAVTILFFCWITAGCGAYQLLFLYISYNQVQYSFNISSKRSKSTHHVCVFARDKYIFL